MTAVDRDAVEAEFDGVLRATDVRVDDVLDVLLGHRFGARLCAFDVGSGVRGDAERAPFARGAHRLE